MPDSKFLEKLKNKWGLTSLTQVILILIVFALTGFSVLFLKKTVFQLMNIEHITGTGSTILYLLFIFPLYQVLLLAYGFIFGQFAFFWEKEKKLLKLLVKPFRRKR